MVRRRKDRRRGAAAVEFALMAPFVVLLLGGIGVGGVGIFRYNQMAWLAREGARYASVRGAQYRSDTRTPQEIAAELRSPEEITAQEVRDNLLGTAARPGLVQMMDAAEVKLEVCWSNNESGVYDVRFNNGVTTLAVNTVSVTVTYLWRVDFLGYTRDEETGEWKDGYVLRLSSTSTMPVAY